MSDDTAPRPRRRKPPPDPTTPDPIEIAMGAEKSGVPPQGVAHEVLSAHHRLIGAQLHQTRRTAVRELGLMAMIAILILAAGLFVWNASRANGLVIQAFTVPPDFVEQGLDGAAVAALFQDEMVRLEAATVSGRAPSSFRNDWSDDITIDLKAGGISLDEAYRNLRRHLGNETYMSGGLARVGDDLSLVVRTNTGIVVPVTAPSGDVNKLIRQAAEGIYEKTQPYRYAAYLSASATETPAGPERQVLIDSQIALLRELTGSPDRLERAWAFNGLGSQAFQSARLALDHYEAGLEVDPEHPYLLANLASTRARIGHDEAAFHLRRRNAATIGRNLGKLHPDNRPTAVENYTASAAVTEGDYLKALQLLTRAQDRVATTQLGRGAALSRGQILIWLHQPSAGLRIFGTFDFKTDLELANAFPRNDVRLPYAEAAAELDRWAEAAAALETIEAEHAPKMIPRHAALRQTLLWPRLAYARARIGDLAGAQAMIAATPLDCYLCVRERARIAEIAGDRPGADRWSAEARHQAPYLPFAFAERGQMLLARGEADRAAAVFAQAHARGPRWADPLKYWGDALAAGGDRRAAIRKYRDAADRAPNWGALHLAWGRALAASGQAEAARDKYRQASSLDLSAADRVAVTRLLERRSAP